MVSSITKSTLMVLVAMEKIKCSRALAGASTMRLVTGTTARTRSTGLSSLPALLHFIRTTAANAVVYRDCKSVVDTYNRLVSGSLHDADKLGEQDLWDDIQHLIQTEHQQLLVVRWMPSHLDEAKNEHKRTRCDSKTGNPGARHYRKLQGRRACQIGSPTTCHR